MGSWGGFFTSMADLDGGGGEGRGEKVGEAHF